MSTTITANRNAIKRERFFYLINAFLITQLLLFIDEGYYDFRWMKNLGNWIIFLLYTGVIFGVQSFFAFVVLRHFISRNARLAGIIGGTILMIAILTATLFVKA